VDVAEAGDLLEGFLDLRLRLTRNMNQIRQGLALDPVADGERALELCVA
jgi:hypothetical protein